HLSGLDFQRYPFEGMNSSIINVQTLHGNLVSRCLSHLHGPPVRRRSHCMCKRTVRHRFSSSAADEHAAVTPSPHAPLDVRLSPFILGACEYTACRPELDQL